MSNKELVKKEGDIVASLILRGDLSTLNPSDRVTYYKGYCERLGLDPYTKPFEILKLQGRESLYLTRSGAQQLNKLHGVSHQITSRQLIESAGIYEVTARAILPDGRYTESMAAVSVSGQKGEQYCNSIMKAETKAKRRSTLDLLGLGVLDETEVQSIVQERPSEVITQAVVLDPVSELKEKVSKCNTIEELNSLYKQHQSLVNESGTVGIFTKRKAEING